MKYKLVLVFAVLLIIGSCKKDSDKAPRQPALIKQFVNLIPNIGAITRSFVYDGARVSSEIYSDSPVEYEYYSDKVIANVFRNNGSFQYREISELDNNGFINVRYQSLDNALVYYFIVKANGFLESEYFATGNSGKEYKYHYNSTGLLDSVYQFVNGALQYTTIYTAYDLSREHTAENENFGKSFLGKKFIHPPLNYKVINASNQVLQQETSVYTYDEQGRVTNVVSKINNFPNYTYTFTYY